jgi:hypothetical protein
MCIDQLNTFNFIVGAKYKLHHRNNRSLSKSSKVGIMLWYEVFVKLMSLKHILKRKKKKKVEEREKIYSYNLKVGVIIFDSVWFSHEKINQIKIIIF